MHGASDSTASNCKQNHESYEQEKTHHHPPHPSRNGGAGARMARIIKIRGQEVLLDRDVAELYGVETKRINEALRNNPDKFPEGYVFTLQPSEKQEVVENFDWLKTIQFSTVEPHAFTERGLYMLATILKSKLATSTTLAIIDSFVKLREISRNIAALHQERDKEKQKSLVQRTGELMNDLLLDDGETPHLQQVVAAGLVDTFISVPLSWSIF